MSFLFFELILQRVPCKTPELSQKKFFEKKERGNFYFEDKEELLGFDVFPCFILVVTFALHPFMVNTSSVPKNIISSSHYRLRQLFPLAQLCLTSNYFFLLLPV